VARLDSLRRLLRSRDGAEPASQETGDPVGDDQA
jgi:hypothetical protein